jgi:hypothetical protein
MEATLIAVVGASGGVGCSTVAAHLAWAAHADRACLVDADLDGGAIDVTVGVDHVLGPRWGDFGSLRGTADGAAILDVLPRTSRYAVLAAGHGGAPPEVVQSVLTGLREACGFVVLDVGRPANLRRELLGPDDLVLVITGLGVRHLADLARAADDLSALTNPVQLLTRGPKGLGDLGDSVSAHVGVPILGHWPDDPRVIRDVERGLAPGERARGFERLAVAALGLAGPAFARSA